jgi:hypothetical protein
MPHWSKQSWFVFLRTVRASVQGRFVQHSLRSVLGNATGLASVGINRRIVGFASTALSHRVLPSAGVFGGIQDFKRCGNRKHVAGDRLPAKGVVPRRLTVLCPPSSPMRHNKSFKPKPLRGSA